MPARESAAVQRAVERVLRGASIRSAATVEQVSRSSVHRALKRRGVPGRGRQGRVVR